MRLGFLCSVSMVLGCLCASLASGADASGRWRAEFQTPDGTKQVNTFVFKVNGERVTGTVADSQNETRIKDGRLTRDVISFMVDRPLGTFTYRGKIEANEITFVVDTNDYQFLMVAKRVR